jgi:hypothetical protein
VPFPVLPACLVEPVAAPPAPSATQSAADALRLAVKIAVDRGDYKGAAEVLELLQRKPSGVGA